MVKFVSTGGKERYGKKSGGDLSKNFQGPKTSVGRPEYSPVANRGFITNVETGENIEFKVNPATMERIISIDWAVIQSPGSAGPEYQYTGGGARQIQFDLVLDGVDRPIQEGGVLRELSQLELLTYPKGQGALENRMFLSPPRLVFVYGPRQWEIIIEKLRITEKVHNHLLIPIFVSIEITALVDLLYSEVNEAMFEATFRVANPGRGVNQPVGRHKK